MPQTAFAKNSADFASQLILKLGKVLVLDELLTGQAL
jgi:hypothetical protein